MDWTKSYVFDFTRNEMHVHNHKTKTSKHIFFLVFNLYWKWTQIDEVAADKVLGVFIDNNLSWTNHVNYLTKRNSQKLYQLLKIKHFINAHARKHFFHVHIQSIVDYASTLWDSASANILKPFSSIHRRALKLILLKFTTLTAHDYKSLDILQLKPKLEYNDGIVMHKIVTGSTPSTLIANFCTNRNRHLHKLIVPLPRLDLFKCSLIFSGGNLWNNLPLLIKS